MRDKKMPKRVQVFGWQSFWNDPRISGHHKQVRCICAANSKAEIKRTYGLRDSEMFNCCTTGNEKEIETARSKPLTVFATSLSRYGEPFYEMLIPPAGQN